MNKGSSLDRALHHDDMNAARELEEEIEQRGLQTEYVFALAEALFGEQDEWGTAHVMKMMLATPKQRARAFIASTPAP